MPWVNVMEPFVPVSVNFAVVIVTDNPVIADIAEVLFPYKTPVSPGVLILDRFVLAMLPPVMLTSVAFSNAIVPRPFRLPLVLEKTA